MLCEHGLHCFGMFFPKLSRTFNVSKEEGDGASGNISHSSPLTRTLLPVPSSSRSLATISNQISLDPFSHVSFLFARRNKLAHRVSSVCSPVRAARSQQRITVGRVRPQDCCACFDSARER